MSVSARPRSSNLLVSPKAKYRPRALQCRPFSVSLAAHTAPRRTQDFTSGFASSYDPTLDNGRGPMFNKAKYGVPQFYPRDLKKRVDEYVVGQDRAKKTICSVIFNHYQSLRRRTQEEDQDRKLQEKLQRQKFTRDKDMHDSHGDPHPTEDEWPGHRESVQQSLTDMSKPVDQSLISEDNHMPHHVKIDKSNLLLIGPTGVGKTYILETLSKQLNVPFTISDCNSFTQAGYIGQDVETCIERLLIEANYDIRATEHGIVVLDEFDKIAKRETMNGRDVGGEGVQQALLKLVEGTKVTVNVKDNRSSRSASPLTSNFGPAGSTTTPQATPPAGKVDQYTIDTSNILFVFCGAFVGLDKLILRRVSKPSLGFGSEIRSRSSSAMSDNKTILPPEMYAHLPHQPGPKELLPGGSKTSGFTPLDLTTPVDLQGFGFIPELIGRVHNISSLSPLSLDELYRILTEPRNSLVAQYTALFETYPSRLYFTQKSLYAIAERASKNETGARGLKMEMERVLAEPIFDSPMPYVLITEGCVKGTEKAGYWGKDGRSELERRLRDENAGHVAAVDEGVTSFEQYRVAGQSGG